LELLEPINRRSERLQVKLFAKWKCFDILAESAGRIRRTLAPSGSRPRRAL
jgi:hypothetical protein